MPPDLRLAMRTLRRNPTYAVAAIVTLGLGIGATTAVFSLAQGILLRALPYEDPSRLVEVYELSPQGNIRPPSYPTFEDWRAAVGESFAGLAFVYGRAPLMPTPDGPVPVLTAYVSPGFFGTLGVTAYAGRLVTGAETGVGAGVVVVSHRFWTEHMGGDSTAVGRTIVLDDRAFVVIGITPPDATYPAWAAVWTPLRSLPPDGERALARRDRHADAVMLARLRDGGGPRGGTGDTRAGRGTAGGRLPRDRRRLGRRSASAASRPYPRKRPATPRRSRAHRRPHPRARVRERDGLGRGSRHGAAPGAGGARGPRRWADPGDPTTGH